MRSSLASAPLITLDSVDSTQNHAANLLKQGQPVGAVLALQQTAGRGRFGRAWHSPPGECLAVSLVFSDYANHHKPYLIGMALAVACAKAFEAQVQWPNDIVFGNRKLGGILTELMPNAQGHQVPVVGVGLNLNQNDFPEEISEIATSMLRELKTAVEPIAALENILDSFCSLPEVTTWRDLEPHWLPLDATPGKRYRLQDGRSSTALRIGAEGELIALVEGHEEHILAADAMLPQ